MGVKKPLIVLVVFLLLLQTVFALEEIAPYNVAVQAITNQIPAGGESEFKIDIKSNLNGIETIQFHPNELDLFPFSEFARSAIIEPSILSLKKGETKSINIKVRSLDTALANKNHLTKIEGKSLTTSHKITIDLNTFVIAEKDLIQIVPKLPEVVAPGEINPLQISFKNRGNIEFEDLELYLTSEVWNENAVLSFEAYENKTEFYSMDLKPGTKSGEYTLSARLYKGKELKGESKTKFTIGTNQDIEEKEESEKGIFVKQVEIVSKNDGNAPVKRTLDFELGLFNRIFTQTSPKAEVIGGKYFWEFTVEPGEEVIVKVTTDYRPGLIGLVVFAAFISLLVYIFTRGVRIKKRVFKIRHPVHGDSEVKVMLHVKNKDNQEAHNIKVIDLIPNTVKLTHEYGTLKPEKAQQGARGIRLIWTLETLSPGEERIISYNARVEKNIIGAVYLPPASTQYINRKAKFVIHKSGSAEISP